MIREDTTVPAGQTFQFKPLIDDATWSSGGNFTGTGGSTIDIYPTFCAEGHSRPGGAAAICAARAPPQEPP